MGWVDPQYAHLLREDGRYGRVINMTLQLPRARTAARGPRGRRTQVRLVPGRAERTSMRRARTWSKCRNVHVPGFAVRGSGFTL